MDAHLYMYRKFLFFPKDFLIGSIWGWAHFCDAIIITGVFDSEKKVGPYPLT